MTHQPCGATSYDRPPAHPPAGVASIGGLRRDGIASFIACMRGVIEALTGKAAVGIFVAACTLPGAEAAQPTAVTVVPGVYALLGSGGEITPENGGRNANQAFIVGPAGVVVVDTGISYAHGEQIIAAVERVTDRPIRLAILTHPSQEAIFGAAAFQARGIPVMAHRGSAELMAARCEPCLRNLQAVLGAEAMAATRVVQPDRLIDGDESLDVIGRPLRLIALDGSSAPGALAVFDVRTSTLITGSLTSIKRVPDMRDADPKSWHDALARLGATRCRHLVSGFGPVGRCSDIAAFGRYFAALENRVSKLLKDGVSLAELRNRSDLPEFARWDQYETLHPQNAHRAYLRLERSQFE
jgi:glyoxylase-like metal-dependent hydrolase (beta-lactamase superfamily II)